MKLISQEQLDDANKVFLYHGAKGAATGLVLSSAAIFMLPRFTRLGGSLTIPIKAFFISSATTVGFVIKGEHGLIDYDRKMHSSKLGPKYVDDSVDPISDSSMVKKFEKYVSDHRYYILAGTWASGMALAGTVLYRKKNLTTSQKIVEARMYAQALTLASLAAVAGISAGAPKDLEK